MVYDIKSKAILFGINYIKDDTSRLRGCINDVKNMGRFLKDTVGYDVVKIYTDETKDDKVRGNSIVNSLYKLAIDSHRLKLDKVWIHFSGHGCSIKDTNNDECDGYDECIVPVDYMHTGVITDDLIKRIFRYFYHETKVVCVFDCCHSGTISDLRYRIMDRHTWKLENVNSKCKANVIMISGCKDSQLSADAYNVKGQREFSGAMTSCLLLSLSKTNIVYDVLDELKSLLKLKKFTQIPQLSASSWIYNDTTLY